jgi:putative transposase
VFNTDQGCQFTSEEFTGVLKKEQIKISMDDAQRSPGIANILNISE